MLLNDSLTDQRTYHSKYEAYRSEDEDRLGINGTEESVTILGRKSAIDKIFSIGINRDHYGNIVGTDPKTH